jgi:hypothetical protein
MVHSLEFYVRHLRMATLTSELSVVNNLGVGVPGLVMVQSRKISSNGCLGIPHAGIPR